jgi:hypothetical protein
MSARKKIEAAFFIRLPHSKNIKKPFYAMNRIDGSFL